MKVEVEEVVNVMKMKIKKKNNNTRYRFCKRNT